ncbi:hypothetical protein CEXT_232501 [Caerostris extrusa]|uniref:Uncharacterized protein n=1 Tax=Caerostris extrusa TaxID=172846 RepID=A0AAV4X517_CAEEX|nr:hypothetical protein CEXT_232501 [Caerostris extrusa]
MHLSLSQSFWHLHKRRFSDVTFDLPVTVWEMEVLALFIFMLSLRSRGSRTFLTFANGVVQRLEMECDEGFFFWPLLLDLGFVRIGIAWVLVMSENAEGGHTTQTTLSCPPNGFVCPPFAFSTPFPIAEIVPHVLKHRPFTKVNTELTVFGQPLLRRGGRLEGSCRRGYSTPGRKRKQESLSGGVERTRVPLPSSFPGQGHRRTLFARETFGQQGSVVLNLLGVKKVSDMHQSEERNDLGFFVELWVVGSMTSS